MAAVKIEKPKPTEIPVVYVNSDNKKGNFTMMPNLCIDKLPTGLTGVLLYIKRKPPNWIINAREIAKHDNCGIKVIYQKLNELVDLGYLTREQPRKTNGKFGKLITRLTDKVINTPLSQNGCPEWSTNLPLSQNGLRVETIKMQKSPISTGDISISDESYPQPPLGHLPLGVNGRADPYNNTVVNKTLSNNQVVSNTDLPINPSLKNNQLSIGDQYILHAREVLENQLTVRRQTLNKNPEPVGPGTVFERKRWRRRVDALNASIHNGSCV
jgi:hypothetical protein